MSRLVIAPDAFKGTLSAKEAAEAMAAGFREAGWQGEIVLQPLADGGEGTLDVLAACLPDAQQHDSPAGPWLSYRLSNRTVAVIESARVLGYNLPDMCALAIEARSSAALGRLLVEVIASAPEEIVVALGGSAVNEAGLGLLLTLGTVVAPVHGEGGPTADLSGLLSITDTPLRIDLGPAMSRLKGIDLTILCDVDAPLTGPAGATRVFGPQKGLPEDSMKRVDMAVRHFAVAVEGATGHACQDLPGAGAAGGLGFALAALGGRLVPGADWIIERTRLDEALASASLVVTGEGRSDRQTLAGKLPWRVVHLAREHRVPAILVSGQIDPTAQTALAKRFACLIEAPAGPTDAALALRQAIVEAWPQCLSGIGQNQDLC